VAVVPDTVQTERVADVKVTASPELALAVSGSVVPAVWLAIEPKVMVWLLSVVEPTLPAGEKPHPTIKAKPIPEKKMQEVLRRETSFAFMGSPEVKVPARKFRVVGDNFTPYITSNLDQANREQAMEVERCRNFRDE
jgi:hypothetical protein